MYFESYKSILFSDTHLSDIFISQYMPSLDGDSVKVYLYCLFLSKYNKQSSVEDLSRKLGLDIEKVEQSLTYLEALGAISRKEHNISVVDLKEKEINKLYKLKTTSNPEDALQNSERNKKRNQIIFAINNYFYQGTMAPSMYMDIDNWFSKYNFEDDIMYALFQHCYDNKALTRPYIEKVAHSWFSRNIINHFDLEKYSDDYKRYKDIKGKISKKLNLRRNLTEYEQEYIEKWVMDYKYDFEIIEIALKKTTAKTNPNFEYINAILVDWSKNGFRTKEEIMVYLAQKKDTSSKAKTKQTAVPQQGNFEQRKYDESYYDKLYENTGN